MDANTEDLMDIYAPADSSDEDSEDDFAAVPNMSRGHRGGPTTTAFQSSSTQGEIEAEGDYDDVR
jgi:hypothetical protein